MCKKITEVGQEIVFPHFFDLVLNSHVALYCENMKKYFIGRFAAHSNQKNNPKIPQSKTVSKKGTTIISRPTTLTQ
jgi:hypothetical protein